LATKIIDNKQIGNHNVNKYNFKALSFDNSEDEQEVSSQKPKIQEHRPFMASDNEVDTSLLSQNSKDSLIESLLKKTDEMSSNFIKLQMKLESMSEEHKRELQKSKQEAYEEGVRLGREQANKDDEKRVSQTIEQLFNSVAKLEKHANEFDYALEGIKKELVSVAIDVAKEVIKVEVAQNSTNVAIMLANELIGELQDASKITLKVNPKDHGLLSQKFGTLPHITVLSDSAIAQGGVIAMSDALNIDAQIKKRFDRVKKVALSE